MKFVVVNLSLLLASQLAFAQGTRIGHVHSKGSDCGIVDVEDAYLISASGKKWLEIKASIQNLGYNKRVYLAHSNGQGAEVMWSTDWWQYSAAMRMDYQDIGRDHVIIHDQMVGPQDNYNVALYVTMNGREYSCSSIIIDK